MLWGAGWLNNKGHIYYPKNFSKKSSYITSKKNPVICPQHLGNQFAPPDLLARYFSRGQKKLPETSMEPPPLRAHLIFLDDLERMIEGALSSREEKGGVFRFLGFAEKTGVCGLELQGGEGET